MIRSILMVKFTPDATETQIEDWHQALAALPVPGRVHFEFHRDLRLTDDAMDAVVIADFVDEAAYRAWVDDAGHKDVRARYLDPIREQRVRLLYEI
jgi:hypothetical protein